MLDCQCYIHGHNSVLPSLTECIIAAQNPEKSGLQLSLAEHFMAYQ